MHWGTWVAPSVKCLPWAQIIISGSCDGAQRWSPALGSKLSGESAFHPPSAPAPACAYMCSLPLK